MSEDVHLIARLVPRAGQEAALAKAIMAIVPAVLEEPGCLTYTAHVRRERPGTIVMYEVWESRTPLDVHAIDSSFRTLAAPFRQLLG